MPAPDPASEPDQLLTVRQVARTLRMDLGSVYVRVRTGAIGAVKLHMRPGCGDGCHCPIRISRDHLAEYLSVIVSN